MESVAVGDFAEQHSSGCSPVLSAACKLWNCKPVQILGRVSNFVVEVESNATGGQRFILRFGHSVHRTFNETCAELEFIRHLRINGVNAARPIPVPTTTATTTATAATAEWSDDAKSEFDPTKFIHRIECSAATATGATSGSVGGGGGGGGGGGVARYFNVVGFVKAAGDKVVVSDPKQFTDSFIAHYGQMLGLMHRCMSGTNFKPSRPEYVRKTFIADTFRDPFITSFDSTFPEQPTTIKHKYLEMLKWVESLPTTDWSQYGLCHADFHVSNFFVDFTHFTHSPQSTPAAPGAGGGGVDTKQSAVATASPPPPPPPQCVTITVFDFDDSGYAHFVMDISVIIFSLLWRRQSALTYTEAQSPATADPEQFINAKFLPPFMAGYRKSYPAFKLSDTELIKSLPKWFKFREMLLYLHLTRARDSAYESFIKPMRADIESDTPYYKSSFLKSLLPTKPPPPPPTAAADK